MSYHDIKGNLKRVEVLNKPPEGSEIKTEGLEKTFIELEEKNGENYVGLIGCLVPEYCVGQTAWFRQWKEGFFRKKTRQELVVYPINPEDKDIKTYSANC